MKVLGVIAMAVAAGGFVACDQSANEKKQSAQQSADSSSENKNPNKTQSKQPGKKKKTGMEPFFEVFAMESAEVELKKKNYVPLSDEARANKVALGEKLKAYMEEVADKCDIDTTLVSEVKGKLKAIKEDESLDKDDKLEKMKALYAEHKEEMEEMTSESIACYVAKKDELRPTLDSMMELSKACMPLDKMMSSLGDKPGFDMGNFGGLGDSLALTSKGDDEDDYGKGKDHEDQEESSDDNASQNIDDEATVTTTPSDAEGEEEVVEKKENPFEATLTSDACVDALK